MSTDFTNLTNSNIVRTAMQKATSKVLESYVLHERYEQKFHMVEFSVVAGSVIESAFGYFVDVKNIGNTNEAKCTILFPPTDEEGVPQFAERVTSAIPYSEYICNATVTKQIVPIGTEPDEGTTVWESKVVPIDEFHAEKTTVTVVELATLTKQEWDEQLGQYVTVNTNLQNTGGTATVTAPSTVVTHTFYNQIKCGWYLRTVETFNVVNRSYESTVDYYWPAVLTDFNHIAVNRKDLPDGSSGGTNFYSYPVFSKEAYRGPTKALIEEVWSLAPASITVPQIMQPLPVVITSPFVSLSIGPCLHASFTYSITITDDPEFESADLDYTFAATTPAARPASLVAAHEQNPSRGGYFRRKTTVYEPTY